MHRCRVCHRVLTDQASIDKGIGPLCEAHDYDRNEFQWDFFMSDGKVDTGSVTFPVGETKIINTDYAWVVGQQWAVLEDDCPYIDKLDDFLTIEAVTGEILILCNIEQFSEGGGGGVRLAPVKVCDIARVAI